jgi:hypothetical protein
MKHNILAFAVLTILLNACNTEPSSKSNGNFDYTWTDEGTFSFTDVNNYAVGYATGDKEALDKALAGFLMNAVENSNLEFLDEENKKITAAEAKSRLTQTITVKKPVPDEEDEYFLDSEDRIITEDDIAQVVAKEDWFFDEKTFSVQKKVTHLALVIYVLDNDGDVRGKKLLYWVKVNY